MITGWILGLVGSVAAWVVGLLPNLPDPAGAISGIASGIGTVMGYAAAMGTWIPWGTVGLCLAIVGPAVLGAVVVHFVRMVYSMFTGGGGST